MRSLPRSAAQGNAERPTHLSSWPGAAQGLANAHRVGNSATSIVLAAGANLYVDRLVGFHEGPIDARCTSFAEAGGRAAAPSAHFAGRAAQLEAGLYERAGRPRRDSASARIVAVLPAQPIASASTVPAAIGARHSAGARELPLAARTLAR